MTALCSIDRECLVNQLFWQDLKTFLRFRGDNIKNAKKSGQNLMKFTSKTEQRLIRPIAGLFLALSFGACSFLPGDHGRPAALRAIKPSEGPVKQASVWAVAKIEPPASKPVHRRPLANLPKPLLAKVVTPSKRLQCVPYARELSNIQIRGNAWTWWGQAEGRYARSNAPKPGSVLVLKRKENSGSLGHVAYVNEIVDSRMIVVSHANWLNEGRLHNLTPVRDVSEANDWSEVRFWHTPGRHFGGHIYRPYGFILPNQTFASR